MTAASDVQFAPVARVAVSDDVYRQLRDAILAGDLVPGAALAGERSLAEQFAVNRHAVREAIRRLEQARLVEVSHGGSTRVLDWHTHAGLELLSELGVAGDLAALPVVRSVVEMRLAIGVDAARLAAQRVTAAAAATLRSHVEALMALDSIGLAELGERYDAFWRLIVAASDNLAYQLADNSLVEALHQLPELALSLSEPEVTDVERQRDLMVAICDHDVDLAGAVAADLLRRMVVACG